MVNKAGVHVYKVEHTPSIVNGEDSEYSEESDCSEEDEGHVPLFPSSHPCIPASKFGTDNGALVSIPILGKIPVLW